jgi:hypothetical protein
LQGILVFVPACLPKKATKEENFHTLVRLWIHEAARVFSDRLTEAETTQFNDALKDIVESEFKLKFNVLFGAKNAGARPHSGDENQQLLKLTEKGNGTMSITHVFFSHRHIQKT